MPSFKNINQKGFSQVIILGILLGGVAVGVYLVGQQTGFLPKALELRNKRGYELPSGVTSSIISAHCSADKQTVAPNEDVTFSGDLDDPSLKGIDYVWQAYGAVSKGTPSRAKTKTVAYCKLGKQTARLIIALGPGKSAKAQCSVEVVGDPIPQLQGLYGQYYNGGQLDDNRGTLTSGRGGKIDENLSGAISLPKDIVSVRYGVTWNGSVKAKVFGEHTFSAETKDGVRVWVNKDLIIDSWTDKSQKTKVVPLKTINLEADEVYDIQIKYQVVKNSIPYLKLSWSAPGLSEEVVPTSQLLSGRIQCGNKTDPADPQ